MAALNRRSLFAGVAALPALVPAALLAAPARKELASLEIRIDSDAFDLAVRRAAAAITTKVIRKRPRPLRKLNGDWRIPGDGMESIIPLARDAKGLLSPPTVSPIATVDDDAIDDRSFGWEG